MIAGKAAGTAEHAVAGHHEGHGIAAYSRADSPRRSRPLDAAGKIGVGGGSAERHLEQRFPDADLKIAADQHDAERRFRPPMTGIEDAARELRRRSKILDVFGARPAA